MSNNKRRLVELLVASDTEPHRASRMTPTERAEIIKAEGWTPEQVKEVLAVLHGGVVDETDEPAA